MADPRRRPLLLRPFARDEDVHCVVYHVVVLLACGAAFWIWLHPDSAGLSGPLAKTAFVVAAALLLGWISGVDVGVNFHNHTHRRIFRAPWLNRWFGRLWTFSGGWPSFFWEHAHVRVHHANVMEADDWTLPRRRPDGRFESVWRYCALHWPWRYAAHLAHDFTTGRGGHQVGRRALGELIVFAFLYSIPFWIDVPMALCLWVLPHFVANCVTMGSGMYVQHAGGAPKSSGARYQHSNTFLSRFFNLTMFNIGYHLEHHELPGLHWADLPALHRRMRATYAQEGARVVPYGYYRAARIVSSVLDPDGGYRRFTVDDQLPEFRRDAPHPQREPEASARPRLTSRSA
ncbi:MAG TPA: fatty acid desaturase [Planctomycetota bacterium]|nr:fatty acid desaturase [Planctomycetota bacterium]